MLATERDDIAATDSEIEQETECEPRLGADRVPRLELSNLVWSSSVNAVGGVTDPANLALD